MTRASLPAGLELTVVVGDTGVLVDRRIGLSMSIPGRPQLLPAAASAGLSEPAYEALIQLTDIPVSLRYRQGTFPPPADATRAIQLFVDLYAADRAGLEELTAAQQATEPQRRMWGVEAAASIVYPLERAEPGGEDMEEALVLYREAQIVTLTKRFSRVRTSWVSWSLFNSALASGIRWDPAVVAAQASPPPLWPQSSFLMPGVKGVLAARRRAAAQSLTALGSHTADRRNRLAERLARLLQGSEAPTHAIGPAERAEYERYVGEVCDDTPVGPLLAELLAEVETAHDLRGFAILCLHALGKLDAAFAPEGEEGPDPFSYVTE